MYEWSGDFGPFLRKGVVSAALSLAARTCEVAQHEITAGNKRRASVALARQLAMYLCNVVGAMSLRDIAEAFSRDRSTVSHACHAIEDRREDPIFDRQMEYLERELRHKILDAIDTRFGGPPLERKGVRLAG